MTASGVLSVPFCAAWAKTCLLARLLFSNWTLAVSCSVSLVLMLFPENVRSNCADDGLPQPRKQLTSTHSLRL